MYAYIATVVMELLKTVCEIGYLKRILLLSQLWTTKEFSRDYPNCLTRKTCPNANAFWMPCTVLLQLVKLKKWSNSFGGYFTYCMFLLNYSIL